MKLFVRYIFSGAILLALLVIAGCDGDPEPVSKVVGKWKVTDVDPKVTVAGGGDLVDYLVSVGFPEDDAEEYAAELTGGDAVDIEGVTMEFKSDGTYVSTDDSGTDEGKWELSSDERTLTTDKGTGGELIMVISKLDDTDLVVTADLTEDFDFPSNTIEYRVVLTFRRL